MKLKTLVGLTVLLTITQLLLVGIVSANTEETGLKPTLKDASLKGAKPGKTQQKIIPVETWKQSHLVATLYQYDSMKWYYDIAPITYGPFDNLSTPAGDVPATLDVEAVIAIDSPLYIPDKVSSKIVTAKKGMNRKDIHSIIY